jgi:hypothetical protein
VLLALGRRRPLLAAIAIAVTLAAFVGPALAGVHGHCAEVTDQHCTLGFPSAMPVLEPARLGVAELAQPTVVSPLVVLPILKVPLAS